MRDIVQRRGCVYLSIGHCDKLWYMYTYTLWQVNEPVYSFGKIPIIMMLHSLIVFYVCLYAYLTYVFSEWFAFNMSCTVLMQLLNGLDFHLQVAENIEL